MKVVRFQALLTGDYNRIKEHIQSIDNRAPIPQALEGGDMHGPLFQCILDADKLDNLNEYCLKNPNFSVYTRFYTFEIDETKYRPDYFVHWRFGDNPITSPSSTEY